MLSYTFFLGLTIFGGHFHYWTDMRYRPLSLLKVVFVSSQLYLHYCLLDIFIHPSPVKKYQLFRSIDDLIDEDIRGICDESEEGDE